MGEAENFLDHASIINTTTQVLSKIYNLEKNVVADSEKLTLWLAHYLKFRLSTLIATWVQISFSITFKRN